MWQISAFRTVPLHHSPLQHHPLRFGQAGKLLIVCLIALFLATSPLRLLALCLAGTAGLLLLLIKPWLIWVFLGVVLPFSSGIDLGPIHATDLLVLAAVALWLLEGTRHRSVQIQPTWLILPFTLYIGALTISLFAAADIIEAMTEIVKWVQVVALLLILPPMLQRTNREQNRTQWLVAGLLVGGSLQAILGIYQFVFRIGPEWFIVLGRFMRASGSFHQPNPYAGYLGLTLPIALSMTWSTFHTLRRKRTETFFLALTFYAGTTGLIGIALLASWSRGGWLGALGSTIVVLLIRSRRALLGGIIATIVITLSIVIGILQPSMIPAPIAARFQDVPAYFGMSDLLNQPLTDENFAIVERLAHWEAARRMWERAPWFGVGPGNYATIYPEVRLPRWEEALGHAHNIYLNTLAEGGIIGLLSYLFLWGFLLLWLWHTYRHHRQCSDREQETALAPVTIGVIGMLCHLSIHNFFDNLFVQGIYLHIALGIAAVLTISQTVDSQTVDSQTVDSQTVDSQTVDSQTVDSLENKAF